MTRKKLLISWSSWYMFKGLLLPKLNKIVEDFEVHLLLETYLFTDEDRILLDDLVKKNLLKGFWILPDQSAKLSYHLAIKRNLRKWKEMGFDVYLTISETLLVDRYLIDTVLRKVCRKICFFPYPGYLLMKTELARKLLGITIEDKNMELSRNNRQIDQVISKFRKQKTLMAIVLFIFKAISICLKRAQDVALGKYNYFINRYFLPFILVGRVFPYGKYDVLTQVGSGRSDVYVFCDEIEAAVFQKLIPTTRCLAAEYPIQGLCRCKAEKKENKKLLVPLSIFMGSSAIHEKYLSQFARDISTVISETGAKQVHLRPHPRETGKWVEKLKDRLKEKGIDAKLVKSDISLRDIVCDYACVVGPLSTALRDARAACDYIIPIGFVGVSKSLYEDPKLVYGKSEGIGWIEEDGSYDREIFKNGKYLPPKRKKIEEILSELSVSK